MRSTKGLLLLGADGGRPVPAPVLPVGADLRRPGPRGSRAAHPVHQRLDRRRGYPQSDALRGLGLERDRRARLRRPDRPRRSTSPSGAASPSRGRSSRKPTSRPTRPCGSRTEPRRRRRRCAAASRPRRPGAASGRIEAIEVLPGGAEQAQVPDPAAAARPGRRPADGHRDRPAAGPPQARRCPRSTRTCSRSSTGSWADTWAGSTPRGTWRGRRRP